jgi:hypothetical protein
MRKSTQAVRYCNVVLSEELILKVWWQYAALFEIYYLLTFIHTIQSHSVHPSPFAEARLLESSSRLRSARGASMGCRAEIRNRACLTASRRTTTN